VTDGWLLAAGLTNLLATPVYLYVGTRLYERPVPSAARLPAAQFSIWWWGIGVSGAIGGIEGILAAFGALQFALGLTLYLVTILGACVFLWGLVGYLLYLYTGRNYLLVLSGFYALFYVITLYWIVASVPNAISVASGSPTVTFAHMLGGPIIFVVVFGLVVPELAAIVLYASLLRRTTERTLRYRIAVVSAALALFFAVGFFTPSGAAWTLVRAVLEAVSALLALIAYFPPGRVQRALGVEAVAHDEPSREGVGRPA
jgi:hypothetical protein